MDETGEMAPPGDTLILDFDGSVSLPGRIAKLDLRRYEEKLRYSAGFGSMADLEGAVREAAEGFRIFFLGSGDFHHVSYMLLRRMRQDVRVIVFDNHPDNMLFPAGIHCGSWVYHACRLPRVSSIAVFGIASGDLSGPNLVQNRFSVLRSGKVKYYCSAPVSRAARFFSRNAVEEIGPAEGRMSGLVREYLLNGSGPVYLSIDKDVLSENAAKSTWDQGKLTEKELLDCVGATAPLAIAADIVGDISSYSFKSPVKRLLRRIDGRVLMPGNLEEERLKHRKINLKILSLLSGQPGEI